jgi:hypothetical protein
MLMIEVSKIRHSYLRGETTLSDAKLQVQKLLDIANKKAAVIAQSFGRKHRNFTFTQVFR